MKCRETSSNVCRAPKYAHMFCGDNGAGSSLAGATVNAGVRVPTVYNATDRNSEAALNPSLLQLTGQFRNMQDCG